MAEQPVQPDAVDDDQLTRLLASAYGAPAIRHEYRQDLAGRLDHEFAASFPIVDRKGTPKSVLSGASEGVADSAAVEAPQVLKLKPRRRRLAIAVAASILLAVAAVTDPPAFAAALHVLVTTFKEVVNAVRGNDSATGDVNSGSASAGRNFDNIGKSEPVDPAAAPEPSSTETVVASAPKAETANKEDKSPARIKAAHEILNQPEWNAFDKPLAEAELSQRLDDELSKIWAANGIQPVEKATDAEFMRRLYLDLTGRIPSVSEAEDFLEDPAPNRRERLVDRLLVHRDHATHLAGVWRTILLPDGVDLSRLGGTAKFDQWLADRFAANVRYDQIVRELILAQGRVSESGPLLFYAALKLNPEELAARTSRAFLGVRMDCAQCHDHPFDQQLSQHDFWGFAAFFARISRPQGKMEATSPVLQVRDNDRGEVKIPQSDEVVPPRLPQAAADAQDSIEGPGRRQQLAEWLTSPHNGQFAKAIVNRVWANLFGRGLVEPVDDMRSANQPIAPAVLDILSRDFVASGFDLRRLHRAIVLTKTYQLSSRSKDNDPARGIQFAQMNVKSFTAEQLYDCIAVATRQSQVAAGPADVPGLERFGDMSRQEFISQFRAPDGQPTDYHAGIPQALTLMHGSLIHDATDLASSGLLKSLEAPFFTDSQRVDTLFLSTLSRYPEAKEREVMLKAVSAATTDLERQQALGDVLWALLNSAEFTFNH